MIRPRRTAPPRDARFAVSVLLALTTVLALLVAPAAPAFALGRLAASSTLAGSSDATSSPRDVVSTFRVGGGELHALKRATKAADRSRSPHGADGSFPLPSFAAMSAFGSVVRAPLGSPLRPLTRIAWQTPARARAHLMVFLN